MPTITARAGFIGAALLLSASVFATADGTKKSPAPAPPPRDVQRALLVGKTPPELVAADHDWLGGPPTTLAALKGNVVWVQFNF